MDLFEHIESFFNRLGVYNQISLTTEMAEVLVKIVIELLSILSIATKEVKRPLASKSLVYRERNTSYFTGTTLILLQSCSSGNSWGGVILRTR